MFDRRVKNAAAAALRNVLSSKRVAVEIEPLESRQLLSAGQLDPLFGNDGIVRLSGIQGSFQAVKAVAGGKTLAAGTAKAADGKFSLFLARFNSDGKLDTTFGNGGEVFTRASGISSGSRLAVLSSGKFYVAGDALARFNANGTLDSTFGTGGVVNYNDGITSTYAGLAVQGDGKIVVMHGLVPDPAHGAGSELGFNTFNSKAEVSRYNANGTLDTTFNKTGRVTSFTAGTAFAGSGDYAVPQDVAMYNGKIILGMSLLNNGSDYAFGVERLNGDGSIDRSFGSSGIGEYYFDEPEGDIVQRIAVSPNGTINLVGNEQDYDWDYITFTPSGQPANLQRISHRQGAGSDIVVQSNGKVIMAGWDWLYNSTREVHQNAAYTVRLNADGSIDDLRVDDNDERDGLGDGPGGAAVFLEDEYYGGGVALDAANNILGAGVIGSYVGTPVLYRLLGGAASAGAVLGTDHTLRVSGTDSSDTINVKFTGSSINVSINGNNFGSFAASSVKRVEAFGNAGNDTITVLAGNVPAYIDGGLGDDRITGGGGANTLFGNDGNDILFPGGGASNDILGGRGSDSVSYATRTHGVEIHLDGKRDSGMAGEHDLIAVDVENAYGSLGNDIIFGNDNLAKGALYGLGGSDTIYAGNAATALYGGDGNDFLYARDNIADYLDGGNGYDSAHIDSLDKTVSIESLLS